MTTLGAYIRRHPVLTFFVLADVASGLPTPRARRLDRLRGVHLVS